jgi:TonB family protein
VLILSSGGVKEVGRMNRLVKSAGLGILVLMLLVAASGKEAGRDQEEGTCAGAIYRAKEVTRRAKITYIREPGYTEKARSNGVRGRVVLTAVLCRTGKVTDIKVVKGLPDGLTEEAVESTRGIKFEPAEKDGEAVSQLLTRECNFNIY